MPLSASNIQLIGYEIAIKWNDDSETYIPLEFMRKHCPCAGCGGEPDIMGHVVKPQVTHTPASFRMKGWNIVGNYALQPAWEDGHNTGLYTFTYLKQLAAHAAIS